MTEDVVLLWDGVTQRLPKGQAIDVPPDSPLERAIGKDKLVPLGATSALPPAAEEPAEKPQAKPQQEETSASPSKSVAPVKKQDAATDGKSSAKDGVS